MKIHGYKIRHTWNGEGYVHRIWANTGKSDFSLPPVFDGCSIGKLEAEQMVFNLTQWYGLPVEEKTIMSHFNKELVK